MSASRYLAITPARDEELYLPRLIESMAAQTRHPDRWIGIDDGSEDGTSALVSAAAAKYPWIDVHHLPHNQARTPGGESVITRFLSHDAYQQFDYIMRIDADISFEAEFSDLLFAEFARDAKLGISGPTLYEPDNAGWHEIRQPEFHTRGAAKMYSSSCLAAIGGLNGSLGWDTLDEAHAMMLGFRTRNFRHIQAKHHRPQGAASGWKARTAAGLSAYNVGYSPLFLWARAVRQSFTRPVPFAGLLMVSGYLQGYLQRRQRIASPEVVKFIRRQQVRRLLFRESLWR
jgi:poly-beta-1,6-N-acetyl-D-glucosamine synthase